MPKKKKTIAQEVEAAARLLQKLVRLKAANDSGLAQCVTCDKWYHWKDLQGGHFISRNHTAVKLDERNVHPQCVGCNAFRMKDSLTVLRYRDYMVDMYGGDGVKDLEKLAYETKKFTRGEVAEIVDYLKEQIKHHEARVA